MGYDVFISYHSDDKRIAEAVCQCIESRALRCFIAPRDITSTDWAGAICNAIESSRAFVVIVSEKSVHSPAVVKEAALAAGGRRHIFPFRIDDAEMSGHMKYYLSVYHWINGAMPPVGLRIDELTDRVVSVLQA